MKIAIIGVGKWGLVIIGCIQNKVLSITLPLGQLQQSAYKGVFV